jgi:hypothetical protein
MNKKSTGNDLFYLSLRNTIYVSRETSPLMRFIFTAMLFMIIDHHTSCLNFL